MRLVHIVIALGIICYAVVSAGTDLCWQDACDLKATLLFHLGPGALESLGLSLEVDIKAVGGRRLLVGAWRGGGGGG